VERLGDDADKTEGFIIVLRDITFRKQRESKQNQA